MPFEYLEGESCCDGADEAQRRVRVPEYVLVEVGQAVVPDCGGEGGEEVEGPGVPVCYLFC